MELTPKEDLSRQLADLKSCEKEPLSFISSVQSHGFLIGFTLPDSRIQIASENVKEFIGLGINEVVAAKLDHVISGANAQLVIQKTTQISQTKMGGINFNITEKEVLFDAYLFESQGLFCLEMQAADVSELGQAHSSTASQALKDFITELGRANTLEGMGDVVCRAIREQAGMDRVMLYRFLPPYWHGEVIAESRVVGVHSYMQHRFPASDIPRIARDLYLRNGVRSIPDSNAPTSKIYPVNNPKTKSLVDLSDSRLRAVSPIHLEYLRNMGVGASYSFAIVVHGELWGLVACHHLSTLKVGATQLLNCELIANAFAGQAALVEQNTYQQTRILFEQKLKTFVGNLSHSVDVIGEMMRRHLDVFEMFKATGMAHIAGQKADFAGLCPTERQLLKLAELIKKRLSDENKAHLAVQSIEAEFPDFKGISPVACGVLALTAASSDDLILIFRPEQIQTIIWGGDPRKNLDKKEFTGRIHPRASFDAWEETVRDHALEWTNYEIENAKFLRTLVFETLGSKQKIIAELSERKKS